MSQLRKLRRHLIAVPYDLETHLWHWHKGQASEVKVHKGHSVEQTSGHFHAGDIESITVAGRTFRATRIQDAIYFDEESPSFELSTTGREPSPPEVQRVGPRTETAQRIRDALLGPPLMIEADFVELEMREEERLAVRDRFMQEVLGDHMHVEPEAEL